MSYEEKVRWLRRYRDALRLEEELRQELEAQRARACKTTAALTGMRDDEILRRRYLLGQTYEKIAESLNISVRYCIKLHKACVQKVHICE